MYRELPTIGMRSSWCLCSCLAQYSQGKGALVWSLALPCWEQPGLCHDATLAHGPGHGGGQVSAVLQFLSPQVGRQ